MEEKIIKAISEQLKIQQSQIENTLSLLQEGATIPFIARYRKEMTKGLDEEQIRVIHEEYEYELHLEKRKEDVLRLIETQGKISDDIVHAVHACTKLSQVEDIYRPYKQKKKTRASVAIQNGLQPLATLIMSQPKQFHVDYTQYLNEHVKSEEDALQMARDIIAEMVSEDTKVRNKIYDSMMNYSNIETQAKKEHTDEAKVYRMYYDYAEKISRVAPHRIMAIDRAEKEKIINVKIALNEEYISSWVSRRYIKYSSSPCAPIIETAILDGLKRLAIPSVERMVRSELSEKAQESSIDIFSLNLEKLLLQAPLKQKVILGFDPAFRTGCKLAIIDATGNVLKIDVIYPHPPNAKVQQAKDTFVSLLHTYKVDLVAIGNGTASRESEQFVANVIKEYNLKVAYSIVSEAGASVYSASKLAIAEFPNLSVEQRSAISIARRLLDPLSELIKIDPQSIGVGQYQHDLQQSRLQERLQFAVQKCVNLVGVNINSASTTLLKNVAGLNASMASSIVAYREEHGKITSRKEILKIAKIGKKSFEQSAGFLRIEDGKEILDRTSIHPESYEICKKVLQHLHIQIEEMGSEQARTIIKQVDIQDLSQQLSVDMYTLQDIIDAIALPLRDYRDKNEGPLLRKDIVSLQDLKVGDCLEGTVRNVVDFGAFVDIGLKEDGLVHISKMSKKRIKHPSEVVSVGDVVSTWVYKIDEEKNKVQLTLLED